MVTPSYLTASHAQRTPVRGGPPSPLDVRPAFQHLPLRGEELPVVSHRFWVDAVWYGQLGDQRVAQQRR